MVDGEGEGISRRRFLGYVVAAPTLVTTVRWLADAPPAGAQTTVPAGVQIAEHYDLLDLLRDAARPTANLIKITVHTDGTVAFALHRTEVGQGISTAIAMVIADEMDVPLDHVQITQSDARPELVFNQLTGGSNSMYTIYYPVRIAAAVARHQLLAAAALLLEQSAQYLHIVDGVVRGPNGASVSIGELAHRAASNITKAVDVQPKDPSEQTLVGTPQNRIDARGMVTGTHAYAMDLHVPNALPTMVCRPPTINGTVRAVHNLAAVKAMPGITDVVPIATGVAVRGATFGQCIDAVRALDVDWGPGTVDALSDADVQAALAKAEIPMVTPKLDLTKLKVPVATVDHTFTFAFQPNCPLEANPAVADVRKDRAEIWAPMKSPIVAQETIAQALGLPISKVTCHVVQAGGSFGRDLFWDAALEAALISKAMGKPVRLMWHRTDDFRHGRAHPACRSTIRIVHSPEAILSFSQHHTSVNTDFGHGLGEILSSRFDDLPGGVGAFGFSQAVFELTQYVPYDLGVVEQLLNETLPHPGEKVNRVFHTGSMRNIYSPNVVTARELALDSVLRTIHKDPYAYRLAALKDDRSKAVLRKVAEVGQWGRSLPAGHAQGIAFHSEYKGRAACLVEIDATPATVGRQVPDAFTGPRVTKVVYAVDVGLAINPRGLEAQMLGGIMDGIANALTFSLHLHDGAYAEDSWDHAFYTRQWNVPPDIQVIVMPPTTGEPGGAGEFGVAASMAATACALARATGTMATSYPVNHAAPLPAGIAPTVPPVPQSPTNGLAVIGR